MIIESRLYNFIDSDNGFSISFLEGQKIIHDLAIIHNYKQHGFSFFRDSLLGTLQLINYLKSNENMGFFIDSEIPYFRLKVEMNFHGFIRTLLLPEAFDENPNIFSGNVRLIKQMPHSPQPYQSVIQIKAQGTKDIINNVLKDSYQVNSKVLISESSDQSILISRLPDININKKDSTQRPELEAYLTSIQKKLESFFSTGEMDYAKIEDFFKSINFKLLTTKDIVFKCNCARERMVQGIASVARSSSIEELFEEKTSLEAKCDYCKTNYLITKKEIQDFLK